MANEVTGASLSQIYGRLSSAPRHHPVGAKTFSDWSVEAGDMITITRDGRQYQSPVHTSSMNWKGGAAELDVGSTGNEKRDPVAKMQKRKYNSGSSGVRNSEKLYAYEVNQDHLLYEVYDSQGRFSKLEVTVRGLFHEVYDTNGRFSVLQNTVNGLRHEVYDTDGRFSVLQNTVNGLRHEVYDTNGRFSLLQNTVDGLHHEVYDTNGSFSTLSNTVDGLHHEVYEEGGAISKLENTAKGFRTSISQVVGPDGRITSASIATAINGSSSEVYISADHIRLSGNMMISALMSGDNSGNLIVANNIYAGLNGSNYIQGKTLRLVGSSSSQGADVQILSSEDIKNMIVKVDTSTPNILKMWKHGSNLSGDPTWTFSKAVSLSGDWNGRNYTVTAKQNNVTVGTKTGIVYDGIVPVEGTITKNSKTVYKDFKVFSDDGEGNADKLIMTKNLSINATSVYNDGWGDSYGQIGLNYTSYGDTYTLNPNGSMTVYPTAKATPSAGAASITTKGITIKARALNLQTPQSAFRPTTSGVTYTPDAGYDGFAQVTVEGDSSLKPENIKKNVEIFNVVGTYEPSYEAPYGTALSTSYATKTSGDVTANGKSSTFTLSITHATPPGTATQLDFVTLKLGSRNIGRISI